MLVYQRVSMGSREVMGIQPTTLGINIYIYMVYIIFILYNIMYIYFMRYIYI